MESPESVWNADGNIIISRNAVTAGKVSVSPTDTHNYLSASDKAFWSRVMLEKSRCHKFEAQTFTVMLQMLWQKVCGLEFPRILSADDT